MDVSMQKILALLAALFIHSLVWADENPADVDVSVSAPAITPLVRQSAEARVNFNAGVYFIDQQLARDKRISDEVLYYGVALQKHSPYLDWLVGLDLLAFGDHVDEDVARSHSFGMDLYFELGHEFRLQQYAVALYAGYNFISGERTYSDCHTECLDEDFGLESGAYVRPALMYFLDNRVSMELSYKSIVQRNVESALQFGLGVRF
jgi:hypothetical protein